MDPFVRCGILRKKHNYCGTRGFQQYHETPTNKDLTKIDPIFLICILKEFIEMVSGRAKKNLVIGYITVFMDVLGYSLISPILPFLAAEMGASDFEEGLLYSGYCLTQAFSPFCCFF